jgi:hypothetical protein
MLKSFILFLVLWAVPFTSQAECISIAAASNGGWQPVSTAPRDGTVVEMLETYGVAPWYGIFKWTKTQTTGGPTGSRTCDGSPSPYEQLDQYWKAHPWQARYYGTSYIPDWFHFNQRWAEWTSKHCHADPVRTFEMSSPEWVQIDKSGSSASEDECLFWRPYGGSANYTDPTHGRQNTVAYECEYLHMAYDKDGDRCVPR